MEEEGGEKRGTALDKALTINVGLTVGLRKKLCTSKNERCMFGQIHTIDLSLAFLMHLTAYKQ